VGKGQGLPEEISQAIGIVDYMIKLTNFT